MTAGSSLFKERNIDSSGTMNMALEHLFWYQRLGDLLSLEGVMAKTQKHHNIKKIKCKQLRNYYPMLIIRNRNVKLWLLDRY